MRTRHIARAWVLCTALLSLAPAARAGGPVTLELTDGSVVTGELLGINGGSYQVRSPSLGTLRVDQADVRVMRRGRAAAAGVSTATADIEAMQRRLVTDPDIMAMIMALRDDPELTAALADPALLQAVTTGDLDAVRGNERFRELMEHPGIHAIIERVEDR